MDMATIYICAWILNIVLQRGKKSNLGASNKNEWNMNNKKRREKPRNEMRSFTLTSIKWICVEFGSFGSVFFFFLGTVLFTLVCIRYWKINWFWINVCNSKPGLKTVVSTRIQRENRRWVNRKSIIGFRVKFMSISTFMLWIL